MQILIYFEDFINELLITLGIISVVILVTCLIILTVSTYKSDKARREMYKELAQKSKNKNKNSKITLEM